MRKTTTMTIVAGALALSMTPTLAAAQNSSTTTTDSTYAAPVESDDDNDFPWGLLGLLGLAGLLGRKKHDTVHVDHSRPRT